MPPPARVLDLTYGEGRSWPKVQKQTLDGNYDTVFMDVDKSLPNLDVVEDIKNLSSFQPLLGRFNAVYYDPPWSFSDVIHQRHLNGGIDYHRPKQQLHYDLGKKVFSQEEFYTQLDVINSNILNLLEDGGKLIVKIMGTRLSGSLILNHVTVVQKLTNLKVIDVIIFCLYNRVLRYKSYTQMAHGYFLIFQRR